MFLVYFFLLLKFVRKFVFVESVDLFDKFSFGVVVRVFFVEEDKVKLFLYFIFGLSLLLFFYGKSYFRMSLYFYFNFVLVLFIMFDSKDVDNFCVENEI